MILSPSFRLKIDQLFENMDRSYDLAAEKSGFVCNGCKDNCCLTRFHHHTLVEYLYLKSGMMNLAPEIRDNVKVRAVSALEQMTQMEKENLPIRVMCPLNEGGLCRLYAHRPMICRLHGLSHKLRKPDGQWHNGPGCDDFYDQCGTTTHFHLDRTPLYMAMSQLERQIRLETGFNGKIKMTIAEMIIVGHDGARLHK